MWLLLAVVAASLCVVVFRAYLRADMLMNFANTFFC